MLGLFTVVALAFPSALDRSPCTLVGVPPTHAHQPACVPMPTEDGGLTIEVSAPLACAAWRPHSTVWPLSERSVLLASAGDWSAILPDVPAGSLLKVDCDSGATRPFVALRPGVDYGTGALTADGRTLFFTGAEGVERLDLRTGKSATVTKNGQVACTSGTGEDDMEAFPDAQIRDVVLGFTAGDRRLRIRRQWGCPSISHAYGSRGDLDLLRPFSRRPREHQPVAVTTLAAGAGGTLWAALGEASCSSDCVGSVVWRALSGQAWRPVVVPTAVAPVQIVADARQAGWVVALGGLQTDDLGPSEGGELICSTDDGATWKALKTPGGGACSALEVVGGDTRRLRVACEGGRFGTRDGGRRWRAFEGEVATNLQTTLVHEGLRYRATRDGLWRRTPGRMDDLARVDPR
ncbi:MAG: hypothetical protein KC549_07465 [Myxococcales bacterium]|nr:hypothetical protein [Myxococcales bacterium]